MPAGSNRAVALLRACVYDRAHLWTAAPFSKIAAALEACSSYVRPDLRGLFFPHGLPTTLSGYGAAALDLVSVLSTVHRGTAEAGTCWA